LTKVSPSFSLLPIPRENRVEALYRGRHDLTAKACIVNVKLMNFAGKVASQFPFPEAFSPFAGIPLPLNRKRLQCLAHNVPLRMQPQPNKTRLLDEIKIWLSMCHYGFVM
jgi:hypothetical protein